MFPLENLPSAFICWFFSQLKLSFFCLMITEIDQLVGKILEVSASCEIAILTIDGADGCGKTYISDHVSDRIGCKVIHLDDFVEKERGAYIEFIRYEELNRIIHRS